VFPKKLLVALSFAAAAMTGQESAKTNCQGTLLDSHGGVLVGAVVTLGPTSVTTMQDGKFAFAASADYPISVLLNGKTLASTSPLHLACSGSVLQLSNDTVILRPQKSGTGGEQLSGKAVASLPLNKRDFSQLLLLAAGTMTDTNGSANFTQQFAINGQRGTAAVFAMDGADSTDPEVGGATFTNLNVDAVQEIRSSSGWMAADIGRGAAGFTDIITRSGTNALHGSAFEFLRNSDLDARNFFDREIPPFHRNEFGFTNGGRLLKDRTFYFVEYQGFRQILSATEVIPVPTVAERSGLDTTAFPGDTLIVPVNPAMAKLLNRYPLPNDPLGPYGARTYAASSRVDTVSDQFSARLDHQLSSKSKLYARFTMENTEGPTTNPSQTAIDPNFAVQFTDQQRNAVINFTHTTSANSIAESSISFTRATPQFPTLDRTDPSLTFGNGLYEAFNAAGGSVQGWFGNLFQARQGFTWIQGKHTIKAGGEVRSNRDTSIFGINPNGQFQFGGGTAYSPVNITSLSGVHNIEAGQPLPDALTGLLTASAFSYNTAVAPSLFPQGSKIGDASIHRDAYNAYLEDSWKLKSNFVLNYGLRYEIDSPIREGYKQTSAPVIGDPSLPGSELVINPQPPYKTDKNGWGPRVSVEWNVAKNTLFRAGGGLTTLLVNLYQDNLLTGAAPYVFYPRLTASPGQLIPFGLTFTSQDLPPVYTPSGQLIFSSGDSKQVPANTVMDVNRFEQSLAAVTPTHQITPISAAGLVGNFKNGYIGTWTAGLEHKFLGTTIDAAYVGTAGIKLPVIDYPNAFPGATAAYSPYTQFNSTGAIIGGYGQVLLMTNRSHSTYHSLQISAQKDLTASGLGFQASYSFSKSIDDTSAVVGGFVSGYSGAVAQVVPENPFDTRIDKGPSNFDIKNALSFSLFQDLHADRLALLRPLGKTLTAGWQLLGIGTFTSGLPFTVYSGAQQTDLGSLGADRPDLVGSPVFSTNRTVREDYFGLGANNTSYFSIPTGQFGTLGRNTFRGPGLGNFDMALIKDTPIATRNGAERASLQFRTEFFNVFNIANFGLPSNIVLGPGFGEISRTASTSRQIQFSLKVIY